MKRNWTVYLIHHSHTDIGYTERQDKITRYHRDFIMQAVDILNDIHAGRKQGCEGFVWQCENYWQVKNFYETASDSYIRDFEQYVRTGEIGLSGNYLNLTELVSMEVLKSRIVLAKEYGQRIGHPITSAMCADINGMAWGYGDALYENGVTSLFSCIHSHHGMFPLYKKQTPFYWESPKGNRVLVWNGDYYHLGNEMFFAPRGGNTYQVRDEYHEKMMARLILNQNEADTEKTEWEICHTRLSRYLDHLEAEGYAYDFVPFMVSGCITDNAPPSAGLARRVNRLNDSFAGRIHFQMVNLEQFFDVVRNSQKDIPCYKGDWNDWWADGVGSTPAAVQIYLDARRKYSLCNKLDPHFIAADPRLAEEAAENMILYAEHTWGYSSSVIEPWEPLVGSLEWKKAGYAINANTAASLNLDRILAAKGEISICQDKGQHYRICNPHKRPVQDSAYLYIEHWEYVEGVRYHKSIPIQVIDCSTNEAIPSQVTMTARAAQVEIVVSLDAGQEMDVRIALVVPRPVVTVQSYAYDGAEGVADLLLDGFRKDMGCVETAFYQILFDQNQGISSMVDKATGLELLRPDRTEAPFSGVYEVSRSALDAREIRRRMGRNRKLADTCRYYSRLKNIQILEKGAVYTSLLLDYELEGTGFYQVYLKIYESMAKLEARVRIHKHSVWEPENLYISLPFTAGAGSVSWLDKTGCVIRPGIDQLPGSNQNFYLLQNGVVWLGQESAVAVAVKDAPLVVFGGLEAGPVCLCDGRDVKKNQSGLYSWVMNNFWETNFKAETGGFYEFTYTVSTLEKMEPEEALARCEICHEGLLSFYLRAE